MNHPLNRATAREAAWEIIRVLKVFTLDDLRGGATISQTNAQRLVMKLIEAGLVEETGRTAGQGGPKQYRLKEDPGILPEAVSTRIGDWRRQAWRTMRIKGEFTVPEIRRTLSVRVGYNTVYRYVRALETAGYVAARGRAGKNGALSSNKVYRLLQDDGPTPPAVETPQRKRREGEHA